MNDIDKNQLEIAVIQAIDSLGDKDKANKAYLEFIKANFIIPIEIDETDPEPKVLYLVEQEQAYLPVFSNMHYFDQWAADIASEIKLLKLSGVDLLKGIGENTVVCLNIGSLIYKEFNQAELARMRSMVIKFFK